MTFTTSQTRRYWLLTSPRTASNLLVRILNIDEQGVRPASHGGYFFFMNVLRRIALYFKPTDQWTAEECADVNEDAKKWFNVFQDHIEASEKAGQRVFVKEHVAFMNSIYAEAEQMLGYPLKFDDSANVEPMRGLTHATHSTLNLTCLPDEFLKTWYPTFLIRHPAMVMPSIYRNAQTGMQTNGMGRARYEPYDIEASMKFVRSMHDFYLEHFGKNSQWPLVLDADDIMTSPELVIKYAGLVELDADKLRFSWEKASKAYEEKLYPAERIMLGFLNGSTGVDKSKVAGKINIDAEAAKWRSEFGDEGGRKLERWVREAMPDYEYLYSRRLTLS
ncbi:hypothetical protein GGS21DRAFT_390077 [Xylaria nigripes]|nr:hypothetical protein GGS21DRAFT_390077 [Xylaria nigripes]